MWPGSEPNESRNLASDRVETNSGLLSLLCDVESRLELWGWEEGLCSQNPTPVSGSLAFEDGFSGSHLKTVREEFWMTSEPGPLVGCLRSGGP